MDFRHERPRIRTLGILLAAAAVATANPFEEVAYAFSVAGMAAGGEADSYDHSVKDSRSLSLEEQQRLGDPTLTQLEDLQGRVTAAEVRSMMRNLLRRAQSDDGLVSLRDPRLGESRHLEELAVLGPVQMFEDGTATEILASGGLAPSSQLLDLLRVDGPDPIFAARVKFRDVVRRQHVEVDTWWAYDAGVLRPVGYLVAAVDDQPQVQYPATKVLTLAPERVDS